MYPENNACQGVNASITNKGCADKNAAKPREEKNKSNDQHRAAKGFFA